MFLPSPCPSGKARAFSEQLQCGPVEGDSVAPRQLPDGLGQVVVETPDCELIHIKNRYALFSESFQETQ